ncbi:MAG: hypothetical protein GTO53_04055 [Planctomycetales bacterium]|nr:hypothetical protein [Planctomycetales bacterium]NIN07806.1 hypothetical protein [Planctomycetales bacterium]NIP03984.1 hypothetical protein [Planctomycetales bacterium]
MDILVRPVALETPIGRGKLLDVHPIELTTGGLVSNAGIAMAGLGMRVAAFSYLGDDGWATIIRDRYRQEGIETAHLQTHPQAASSTTVVLIDPLGERSFAHSVGAPKKINRQTFLDRLDLFANSRMALIGYYSLMPNLESDLPEVLAAIRQVGCQTALDSAGSGGGLQPLDRALPYLDIYVPSRAEAEHQTGQEDPERMIEVYRRCGAPGLLGVKLGSDGALLSPTAGQFVKIRPVRPPGDVVDTTGAGDCFYAGLLTGLLMGLSVEEAGRLGAATGACCVTGMGATAGLVDRERTLQLAGLADE